MSITTNTRLLVFLAICAIGFAQYQPNWDSLDSRPNPDWYDDAKYGIFIHWGVYSVPSWGPKHSYAEWYWNYLEQGPEYHVATYGENYKYQEFAHNFKAELFNPDEWVDFFVQVGAKYIVPTSKHHDSACGLLNNLGIGTQLVCYEVILNSPADIGPKRDLLGSLFESARQKGIHPCLYYSLYEWFNPLYRSNNPHEYVDLVMLPQLHDLIENYQPHLIFSDGAWEHPSEFWNSTSFLAWLYNDSPVKDVVVVNDRWGNETEGHHGGYYSAEYSSNVWLDKKWEENSGIDVFSYGYNRNSNVSDYLTTSYLVNLLVRTVAYGGNLLLDVGPASDGTIPVIMQQRLLDIGNWLSVNGEAIYSTRYWAVQSEQDFVFYTTKKSNPAVVYAIITQWPKNGLLKLNFVKLDNSGLPSFEMLGYEGLLDYTYDGIQNVLSIQLPSFAPNEVPCQYAWTVKMTNVDPVSQTVPLHRLINNNQKVALCASRNCESAAKKNSYSRDRMEGLAFASGSSETQLMVYYSQKYDQYVTITQDYVKLLDASFELMESLNAFVSKEPQNGLVALELYQSKSHGYVTGVKVKDLTGYELAGTLGYVFPGPPAIRTKF